MRKLLLLILFLSSFSVLADFHDSIETGFSEDQDTLLQPLIDTIRPWLQWLSVLVGGVFGVYLILLLARVYYERKKVKLLEDIRYDLDHLNMHYGVPYSRGKKGFIRKCWGYLFPRQKETEKKKKK